MHVILERIEDTALNIKTFWFRPDRSPNHTAGQFTQIKLPVDHPDKRGNKHWFTVSSSPTEELIGITTKFAARRGSKFKHVLEDLKLGAELNLAEPMGDFVLPKNKSTPLLFVAGGIGVTPYRSILKWLLDNHEKRDIHLLYSVRDSRELAFLDLIERSGVRFTPIVTEPDDSWKGETGVLTPERIIGLAGRDAGRQIYISGPEPMVEQFVGQLKNLGVSAHRLVTDYFPGYETI